MTLDEDRSAALLLRVWREDGPEGFRARLTSVDTTPGTPDAAEVVVGVTASPDQVLTMVGTWLTRFLGTGTQPDAGPDSRPDAGPDSRPDRRPDAGPDSRPDPGGS